VEINVFFDWIAREGWMVLSWWLLATVAGLGALPLCFRLLHALPDKGYTLARAAGLLMTGFVFWLLAVLGFLRNEPGSIVLSWMIVLAVGLLLFFRYRSEGDEPFNLRDWWRENRGAIITAELLFALVLVVWSLYRANQNEIYTTEKPMDLAFISTIMRSPTLPPPDPWASGFSISYYYFGYVIAAMISTLAGTVSTIGYNIWTAMLFALAAVTSFGVVYNLVRSRKSRQSTATVFGVVGALLLTVMSNYEFPLVDLPYNTRTASAEYLAFWDVRDREAPRPETAVTDINGWDGWWWFRAARTIKDRNLEGTDHTEVINEFPMFSYVLADNHPHVMALPFTLLAMGMGLNILLSGRRPKGGEILFYGLVVGGLAFLNTWDSPIYIMILVGAELLRRIRDHRYLTRQDGIELVLFGGALLLITLVAYAPFIVNFRSQLGGILPNVYQPVRFRQYFLVFGALLPLITMFAVLEAWRGVRAREFFAGFALQLTLSLLLLFIVILVGMLLLGANVPQFRTSVQDTIANAGGWGAALSTVLQRRFDGLLTLLFLLAGLFLISARLFPNAIQPFKHQQDQSGVAYPAATGYALLLVAAGLGLTLIPEFVYLRDNFGTRMNTVFKFYYQAWAMFAVGSAYGLYTLLADRELIRPAVPLRFAVGLASAVLIGLGLLYAPSAFVGKGLVESNRYNNPNQPPLTLDGARTLVTANDLEVLRCLQELVGSDDVVLATGVEGPFDSYDYYSGGGIGAGRAGAMIGVPNVWGWGGHQSQWRGRSLDQVKGSRFEDLRELYTDLRMDVVQEIIDRYSIDYILYGDVERNPSYYGPAGEQKFLESYEVVCESGNSRVFKVDDSVLVSRE
jgi:YYY domain-containing protein